MNLLELIEQLKTLPVEVLEEDISLSDDNRIKSQTIKNILSKNLPKKQKDILELKKQLCDDLNKHIKEVQKELNKEYGKMISEYNRKNKDV